MTRDSKALVLFTIFVAMVPIAVLISAKLANVFGLTFTVGAYAYAVTFPCTDIIGECFGKKRAKQLVHLGLLAYLLTFGYAILAVSSPPAAFWSSNQEAYKTTLGLVPRIVIGSVAAYYVSQLHDVWAFHFWRRITNARFLWMRNNLSTMTSQLVDTVIFVLIAFAGVVPRDALLSLVFGQYVLKLGIAIIDTPLVYLGVRWIGRRQSEEGGAAVN